MWVWRHRYMELVRREDVDYVYIFENRGVEVGVTLHHPHGQIYGYPFLPPVPALELAADARLGGCAPCTLLELERADGRRVLYENEAVTAYVPHAARWPYEAHLSMRRHRASLLECEPEELRLLSVGLQALVRGYDALFDRPMPYVMAVHQAPTGGTRRRAGPSPRRVLPAAARGRQAQVSRPARSRERGRSSQTSCRRTPQRPFARRSSVPARHCRAFAPGRVNLIGEHTDYNQGLALPFAIAQGIVVSAEEQPATGRFGASSTHTPPTSRRPTASRCATPPPPPDGEPTCGAPSPSSTAAGMPLTGSRLEISGDLPRGAGLSSSAALSVALCLALAELGSHGARRPMAGSPSSASTSHRSARGWSTNGPARRPGCSTSSPASTAPPTLRSASTSRPWRSSRCPLCSTAGISWWPTLASATPTPPPATTSAARSAPGHASCSASSRCATSGPTSCEELPDPEQKRAAHVLSENERVRQAVSALRDGEPAVLGELMNASHESLRDLYQVSTPAVEATVERLLRGGASGARLVGGGFGGAVLALLAPGVPDTPGSARGPPRTGRCICSAEAGLQPRHEQGHRQRRHGQRHHRQGTIQWSQKRIEGELLCAAIRQPAGALDLERPAAEIPRR